MSENIPFEEIQEYVKNNCPYNGLCFIEDIENKCPYEIMDNIPCRYMPELIIKFKEIHNERKKT